jgi:hypothetical protein
LTDQDLETNRRESSIRSRAEHIFGGVKGFFGFKKVRYRSLAKNENYLNVLFALSNLSMSRNGLRGDQWRSPRRRLRARNNFRFARHPFAIRPRAYSTSVKSLQRT